MSKFLFKNGERVLFIGDSITDCGRRQNSAPLGDGYVKLAIDLIRARYPERKIDFINKGISGNTIRDLSDRWQDDALRHNPDWLSIKVGINDLRRTQFCSPDRVRPEEFEKLYDSILQRTRKATSAKLILIDPFFISLDQTTNSSRNDTLKLLPLYLKVVQKMAKKFKTLHVRSDKAFKHQLRYHEGDTFCPEPVHPNTSGHMILAHELLHTLHW